MSPTQGSNDESPIPVKQKKLSNPVHRKHNDSEMVNMQMADGEHVSETDEETIPLPKRHSMRTPRMPLTKSRPAVYQETMTTRSESTGKAQISPSTETLETDLSNYVQSPIKFDHSLPSAEPQQGISSISKRKITSKGRKRKKIKKITLPRFKKTSSQKKIADDHDNEYPAASAKGIVPTLMGSASNSSKETLGAGIGARQAFKTTTKPSRTTKKSTATRKIKSQKSSTDLSNPEEYFEPDTQVTKATDMEGKSSGSEKVTRPKKRKTSKRVSVPKKSKKVSVSVLADEDDNSADPTLVAT